MRLQIRPGQPNDVPQLLPMVRAICDHHAAIDPGVYDYLPDVVERYRGWLARRAVDPRSVLLIAEDQAGDRAQPDHPAARSDPAPASPGALTIGFLVGEVLENVPIYRTTEFGFIHDLWVEPRARRFGVARAMVIEALRRFERIGVTQVRAETAAGGAHAGNEHARAMFRGLGFRPASVEMVRQLP